MSATEAATYCEAIEGHFVWGAQLCMRASVASVPGLGDDHFGVCADHLASMEDSEVAS